MTKDKVDELCGWVYTICSLAIIAVPAIWAFQIYHWLRWAEWKSISLRDGLKWAGLAEPRFEWIGVQRVIEWLMESPLSIALFVTILGVAWGFTEWGDKMVDKSAPKNVP